MLSLIQFCLKNCKTIHLILYNFTFQSGLHVDHINWVVGPVKFFINTEGCGYPPRVNCTEFSRRYGAERDTLVFPCYYSKRYPEDKAVAHFDWNDTVKNLVMAIGIPNVLFGLSIGILSYWYCWPSPYDRHPNILSTTYATFDSDSTRSKKIK